MVKPGIVGFSVNRKGLLPKLIKFFTGSRWSHSFLIVNPIYGLESVQEASLVVQFIPFDAHYRKNVSQEYVLFAPSGVSEEKIEAALTLCYREFAGVKYGYLSLFWFVYRWLMEKIGVDVRKRKNWMSDGVICSELVFYFLEALGEPFTEILADFNPDTIQPEDLYKIVVSRQDLFESV